MINPNNYNMKQIEDALRMTNNSRKVSFRYDLLNRNDIKIGTLDGVTNAKVTYGEFRVIKRSATFGLNVYMQKEIDFIRDQIQPWFILHMPTGGTVEWPLGIFLLESPSGKTKGKLRSRNIGAYDKTIIIDQDRFDERHFIEAGTNFVGAITRILNTAGITKVNIAETHLTLPSDRELPIGMKKLHAVNELLSSINYTSVRVDEAGFMRADPYVEPARRPVTQVYNADKDSIVHPEISESLDIAGRPNVFIRVSVNVEKCTEMVATFANNDPQSPISTINRGRRIVNFEEIHGIANQETLESHVRRIGIESTSAFSHLTFSSALMPTHGSADTLLCIFPEVFAGSQKWSETSWEMDLKFNGEMKHEARKVSQI